MNSWDASEVRARINETETIEDLKSAMRALLDALLDQQP
jgi:hypothetical protein